METMTLMEASRQLGISYWTLYRRWEKGKLPHAKKKGRGIMVSLDDALEAVATIRKKRQWAA